MQHLFRIIFISLTVFNTLNCSKMDDIRYNMVNNFMEITSKVYKHHEARFRSFVRQDGTPISAIRVGRSTKERK